MAATSPPGEPASDRQLPLANTIIIGVAKAGTTSLFAYLAAHPDVLAASSKETDFFLTYRFGDPPRPLEEYGRHFAHGRGEPIRLEASPSYFPGGGPVARAIRARLGPVRLIVLLRDPVQRAYSCFRFSRYLLEIPESMGLEAYLEASAAADPAALDRRQVMVLSGVFDGHYVRWLREWVEVFGWASLRVAFFEDLVADPRAVTCDLLAWLGLDPARLPPVDLAAENATRAWRSRPVHRLVWSLRAALAPLLAGAPRLRRWLRRGYERLNTAPSDAPLPAELGTRLQASYRASNLELQALLESAGYRRFPPWLAREAVAGD